MVDVGLAVSGFVQYVFGIMNNFSGSGRDEQVAWVCMFVGFLLLLVSVVLFFVM